MRALLMESFEGPLALEEVADPVPTEDGVVIGVRATGLCRSDWHAWMGHDRDVTLPHVPGHEFVGVVQELGHRVERFQAGDRVTVPFCVGCGRCEQCRLGHQQVCDRYFQPGFTAWGSFAERVAIPHADNNLVRLPESMDDLAAASLGCRFVTAYRGIIDQAQLRPEQWLAVHGCGGVGLSAIQIAKAHGAYVVGVDVHAASLEMAKQLGADSTVMCDPEGLQSREVVREIREVTAGGAHVAVDAVGSKSACLQSVRCLRKRGCHVQIGLMVGDDAHVPVPMHIVIAKELRIVGSHGMSATQYGPMLEMIRSGRLQPGQLVDRQVGLADLAALLPRVHANDNRGITVAVVDASHG